MQGEVIMDNNYVLDTQIKAYISNAQNNYQQSIKGNNYSPRGDRNTNCNIQNTQNNIQSYIHPSYSQSSHNQPSVSAYIQNSDIQCKQPENQYLSHLNAASNVLGNMQTLTHRYIENNPIMDNNNYRYVGYSTSTAIGSNYFQFFSDQTVDLISKKITELTMGVSCDNRPIIVPNDKILHIMSQVFSSNKPNIADMYAMYNIPGITPRNDVQQMINRTIQIIVNDIEVNLGFEQNNAKLNIWTTQLGDYNEHGLQSVSYGFAKVKKRRPQPMFFWSTY